MTIADIDDLDDFQAIDNSGVVKTTRYSKLYASKKII